jgi:hypothetical protein
LGFGKVYLAGMLSQCEGFEILLEDPQPTGMDRLLVMRPL